jgi:uncharacterized protein
MKISRRTFMTGLGGVGGLAALAGGGWGYLRWGEADWFEPTQTEVATGRTAATNPVRVLHLSDFHASDVVPLSMIARAITLGIEMRPDLIVLTGDFWTDANGPTDAYADVLGPLAETAPTFAVAGNHDGGGWAKQVGGWDDLGPLQRVMARAGIRLLWNETASVSLRSRELTLLGVGDWWSGECMPHRTFAAAAPRSAQTLRILLNHNPDAKFEFADYDWDLMCCGHTHGGQFKVPFLGQTPFAPIQDHAYVAGLNPWGNRLVFTTRGVGNLHGVRLNCRPEISLLLVS